VPGEVPTPQPASPPQPIKMKLTPWSDRPSGRPRGLPHMPLVLPYPPPSINLISCAPEPHAATYVSARHTTAAAPVAANPRVVVVATIPPRRDHRPGFVGSVVGATPPPPPLPPPRQPSPLHPLRPAKQRHTNPRATPPPFLPPPTAHADAATSRPSCRARSRWPCRPLRMATLLYPCCCGCSTCPTSSWRRQGLSLVQFSDQPDTFVSH